MNNYKHFKSNVLLNQFVKLYNRLQLNLTTEFIKRNKINASIILVGSEIYHSKVPNVESIYLRKGTELFESFDPVRELILHINKEMEDVVSFFTFNDEEFIYYAFTNLDKIKNHINTMMVDVFTRNYEDAYKSYLTTRIETEEIKKVYNSISYLHGLKVLYNNE